MKKWSILLVFIVLLLAACKEEEPEIETNMSDEILDFEFTTQDEETLSSDDLQGQYWIADMIFTNCTTVCLPMTTNMSKLQDTLAEEGIDDVHLVSFSVDPDYDSPEVLREYAELYDADLDNWSFLTGYDFETIHELSVKSFRSLLQEPESGDDQVTHGTRFYLIDPEGNVIKNYSGTDAEELDLIVEDLKAVSS